MGIRHVVAAEISVCSMGSLAGTPVLLVPSIATGSPSRRSFLVAVGSCLACPLGGSHLFSGHPSGALACPGSRNGVGCRTAGRPVDRDWAGTVAFYPVLLLEPGPEVHSVVLVNCTRN